jgi:HD superfamily phosphohydrolase
MMLTKAVSMLDSAVFEDVFKDTDASLSERLIRNGGFPRDIALRLKYRRLYKTALLIDMDEMDAGQREAVSSLVRKGRLSSMEDEICDELGVEHGSVIIDAAQPEYLSGAGIKGKTVVPIMDESGVVRPLTRLSSIARAVQQHSRQEWGLMVAREKRLIPRASAIARRTIFS